ncbi:class I adenylate-forming enzyme family protein [Conexibacter stalactiti]|uniref:Class I adenylate-forming enzyme family protein n=1 Tax=Conexibacter stalactiti TaxID=1940611 RepID=A0ABU4HHM2_9ACTN|nr:class I adenylate-forming enzyme family protein [Conexibacter stalactiti]MDW5592806.1 class I adenylate-forming enzyme family protein [Conexibacter stalactiti]MEC5033447.1 class I adenylate-forming enzyme family protein [Conexibacter stalactiti]
MGAETTATPVSRTPPPTTAVHTAADAARYRAAGWWGTETVGDHVARARAANPGGAAFVTATTRMSWAQYDDAATALAQALAAAGFERGQHLAVLLPDGPTAHVAYLAAERAGLVVIGVAARSGVGEIVHLLRLAEADALLTHPQTRGVELAALLAQLRAEGLPALRSVVVPDLADPAAGGVAAARIDGAPARIAPAPAPGAPVAALTPDRRLHPDETFLLNSTSGTTGLPKCVVHSQQPWLLAGRLAITNGGLTAQDTILCAVPTPYGFGLWSGHVAPALLGVPTVLLERFDVELMLELIERERVTMLAAVTTQLAMVLQAAADGGRDLSSLRVVFTGGEAVPPQRAAAFERLAGAKVLQFYGANETGIVSGTTVADDDRARLRTAGRPAPGVELRLGGDGVTPAAVRGPGLSGGYHADPAANAELLDGDGWMRTGDLLELDADGCLNVVGRASDIVIRGGKNISAPAVEAEVATHPLVAVAAVVAMPDPVFGERVCVYAALERGTPAHALTLDDLVAHLSARGMTREWMPERLVVLDALPLSAGGKVAKTELREDIRRRLAAGQRPETGRAPGGGAA